MDGGSNRIGRRPHLSNPPSWFGTLWVSPDTKSLLCFQHLANVFLCILCFMHVGPWCWPARLMLGRVTWLLGLLSLKIGLPDAHCQKQYIRAGQRPPGSLDHTPRINTLKLMPSPTSHMMVEVMEPNWEEFMRGPEVEFSLCKPLKLVFICLHYVWDILSSILLQTGLVSVFMKRSQLWECGDTCHPQAHSFFCLPSSEYAFISLLGLCILMPSTLLTVLGQLDKRMKELNEQTNKN